MWAAMKRQFEEDRQNLQEGNAISLLAKWIKTADASSANTRKLGILTAQKLGYSVYEFKRLVRAMRKQIGIVEALMSAGRWDEIRYSAVPSRAMMIYRRAFMKHDADRYSAFVQKAVHGEETIHSATLFPYDIVERVMESVSCRTMWKQGPMRWSLRILPVPCTAGRWQRRSGWRYTSPSGIQVRTITCSCPSPEHPGSRC